MNPELLGVVLIVVILALAWCIVKIRSLWEWLAMIESIHDATRHTLCEHLAKCQDPLLVKSLADQLQAITGGNHEDA